MSNLNAKRVKEIRLLTAKPSGPVVVQQVLLILL